VQSNRLPASTRLELCGSLLDPRPPLVRKGVTYRDTRESTEGLGISRRSVAVVAAWFRARFTARERTTYGISVEVPIVLSLFLILVCSPPCVCVYSVYLADPQRSSSSFTGGADQSASRGFTARGIRTTLVRLRALLPATRQIRSLSFHGASGVPIFFFERVRSPRNAKKRERGGERERERLATRTVDSRRRARLRKGAAFLLFCGSAPPTDMKYTAYGNLVSHRLRIPELSASEFLVALFCDFTLEL
jgi:hypothetical protein